MGCTLLLLLVILLHHDFSTTVAAASDKSDDFATWASLPCRRCKFYSVKVDSGGAVVPVGTGIGAAALPEEKSSSGNKTNVGAVVGFTFLLVFVIAIVVVCIYRNRRSPSRPRITTQQPVVVQPIQAQELFQRPTRPEKNRVAGEVGPKEGVRAKKVIGKDEENNKVARPKRPSNLGQGQGIEERGDGKKKKEAAREVIEPKGDVRDVKGRVRVEEVVGKANDDDDKVARPNRPNVGQGQGVEERKDEKNKGVVEEVIEPKRKEVRHSEKRGDMERQRQKPVQVEKVVERDDNNDNFARPKRPNNVGQGQDVKESMDEKKGVVQELIEPKQKEVRHQRKRDGNKERKRRVQLEKEDDDDVVRSNKRGREGKQPLQDDDHLENEYKRGRDDVERKHGELPQEEFVIEQENSLGLPNKYSFGYLMIVTNRFDINNVIGGGSFGTVYRGTLVDGTVVAVKLLRVIRRIDDFRNEVDALGKADHCNLVKLNGYCNEGENSRILVYEYMKNGSLYDWIFNLDREKSLTWPEMKNIIKGIAEGLEYLHVKHEKKILHRDLKPANILLDDNKNAKLCDFGIAKLLNKDQSSTSTVEMGSGRYKAPEAKKGRISDKVDVYSFGAVALEVMFGKPWNSLVSPEQIENVKEFKFHDLIMVLSEDMRKNGEEIAMIGKLAFFCLREKPEKRPTMSGVVAAIRRLETRFKTGEARRN